MNVMVPYTWGLIALLVFVLITLVQAAMVGAGKAHAALIPGSEPQADYDSAIYRLNRSHQNSVENLAPIATAFFACVLTGVSPWWVNLLMALFLLLRFAYLVILANKVGAPTQGPRTFVYVAGWAMNVALVLMAGWASF